MLLPSGVPVSGAPLTWWCVRAPLATACNEAQVLKTVIVLIAGNGLRPSARGDGIAAKMAVMRIEWAPGGTSLAFVDGAPSQWHCY